MIGNHPPRRCGIATFTQDTARALRRAGLSVDVIAMSDHPGHAYPNSVLFEIPQDDLLAYEDAARRINLGGYDLVNVQHEYGIYGGRAGSHLLTLLRELNMPIVSTVHTALQNPNADQKAAMDELASLSAQFVVMSEKAKEILQSVHGIPDSQLTVLPHGIPDLPEEDPEEIKRALGVGGKKVILTFGLLSPDKGIEYAIDAMAEVPNATYVVLGQTHPHIKRDSGEAYRESLQRRAEAAGVADQVVFLNQFVDDSELARFLKMADLYVTPYLNEAQVTSGTLAYTVGNGKAVISTPYWHAKELLSDGRGILVPFRNAHALGAAMARLLEDGWRRAEIERKAYDYGRQMTWPRVAEGLLKSYRQASGYSHSVFNTLIRLYPAAEKSNPDLPEPRLEHLEVMTDDTGIIQHARYSVPNRDEGYCLDDNARALQFIVKLEAAGFEDHRLYRLQNNYLSFCAHALDKSTGRFRNFLSYDRRWLEKQGSEDSHARALWALSETAANADSWGARRLARELFESAQETSLSFMSPRAWGYSLMGFVKLGKTAEAEILVGRLMASYLAHADGEWNWFENSATYANARLSQAMIVAGRALDKPEAVSVGLKSLNWLCEVQNERGRFCPIGNDGFLAKGKKMPRFDQQPLEAAAHVSACLAAWEATRDPRWKREAERAFGWFLGNNVLGARMAECETGGCRDGLLECGPNENQGAESTISYLSALTELSVAKAESFEEESGEGEVGANA